MFGEEKSLKDTHLPLSPEGDDQRTELSYTKANKLITALFMVTDIMDKEEPLRNKLRTLGIEIISDMHSKVSSSHAKISEVMSFLDIAQAINLVSEMNANILKKEFFKMKQGIERSMDNSVSLSRQVSLDQFFSEEEEEIPMPNSRFTIYGAEKSIRHQKIGVQLGVQKGSTLLKALSDRTSIMSNINSGESNSKFVFNQLRKDRKDEIISIIKSSIDGATITDIKLKSKGVLASCGEKTLQRELTGMVREGVLNKKGEKRWSRYFLHQVVA